MEAVTVINAYQEYQGISKSISRRFGPRRGSIDHYARGYDDLAQELRLCATKIADRFQRTWGFCATAERRYVYRSLFNQAQDWRITDSRRQKSVQEFEAVAEVHTPESYDMTAAIEARQSLETIWTTLVPEDREILFRVACSGGSVQGAWVPQTDGSLKTFTRKVARLRQKAKMLQNS